jgi:predicted TIM-barrel fold metal-dependent hydrolase
MAVGTTAPAGWPTFPPEYPGRYEECHPGAYQSSARLAYMDSEGIWAQVLYPNVGGFGSQNFLEMADEQVKLMCVTAYNDFLLEWASADPRRLLPVVATPYWDISATLNEIERCVPLGAQGILFTGEPQRYGLPLLGSTHWDPLWDLAQSARLPVHFHIGGDSDMRQSSRERFATCGVAAGHAYSAVSLFMKNGVQCCDLITSNVLNRFPDLKFVSVESGIGWLPFMLEATDYSWLGAFRPGRQRTLTDVLPSDLFQRQVFVTYWFECMAPKHLLDLIPVDNIMFETDFPHTACLFGNIQQTIAAGLGDVDMAVRRKILWDNAATLYGISPPPPEWTARTLSLGKAS